MELKIKKSGRGLFIYLPKNAGYAEGETVEIPEKEGCNRQSLKNHLTEERVIELIKEHTQTTEQKIREVVESMRGGF